tara:strand:- start:1018 stop:1197 length:180 start_codon:yes stop_codon:yes gene_type:complete
VRLLRDLNEGTSQWPFLLQKSWPVTFKDEEVALDTRVANNEVKKKFDLEDMVFNGHLEP